MSSLSVGNENTGQPATSTIASRSTIVIMAIIAGAVVTNVYCIQPILPLIASNLRWDLATVDLVASAALLGFATGRRCDLRHCARACRCTLAPAR